MFSPESVSTFGAYTNFLLANVPRAGWVRKGILGTLCESVADHSYRSAQAAWLFTGDLHLVQMLLVHDWAENIVGDITPHDKIPDIIKHAREREAMGTLTGIISYGSLAFSLWEEYTVGQTKRAILAKQLDKLDAGVLALRYEQMGFDVDEFFGYTEGKLFDSSLRGIFDTLRKREHNLLRSPEVYFSLLKGAQAQVLV